jgi:hypothetical protein
MLKYIGGINKGKTAKIISDYNLTGDTFRPRVQSTILVEWERELVYRLSEARYLGMTSLSQLPMRNGYHVPELSNTAQYFQQSRSIVTRSVICATAIG